MSEEIPVEEPRRKVPRVFHPSGGEKMTKEADREQTDINKIVERWVRTGELPKLAAEEPRFGDFSAGVDFHGALMRVEEAKRQFWRLPPHVRKACDNDPAQFLDLVSDPARADEVAELGLTEYVAGETDPAVLKPPPSGQDGSQAEEAGGADEGSEGAQSPA